jgi:cytoskeletal protein CcmA (bactofilin family)
MSDAHISDDAFINSIIGEGTRFKGEFDLNGLLRIDGDFTGTIRTKGKVLVGRNGRAECTLHAGTVVIGGVFRGEIFSAEKVIILSTGLVLGNITTPRLIVEEGVIFNGTCRITTPSSESAKSGSQHKGSQGGAPASPPREAAQQPAQEAAQSAPGAVPAGSQGR